MTESRFQGRKYHLVAGMSEKAVRDRFLWGDGSYGLKVKYYASNLTSLSISGRDLPSKWSPLKKWSPGSVPKYID